MNQKDLHWAAHVIKGEFVFTVKKYKPQAF